MATDRELGLSEDSPVEHVPCTLYEIIRECVRFILSKLKP